MVVKTKKLHVKKRPAVKLLETKSTGHEIASLVKESAGFSLYISQSAISRFLECRVKAGLTVDGWYAQRSSRALRYGSMFHAILEAVTRFSMSQGQVPSPLVVRNAAMEYVKGWEEENQEALKSLEIRQEMLIDAAIISVAIEEYIVHHREDFDGSKEWLSLESKFSVPYKGITLYGYIDAVYRKQAAHYIFETKTKGKVESNLVDLLHVDFQSFYYIHAYFVATGIFPSGLVYNVARKFGSKIHQNESIESYATRFRKDIQLRPDFYFVRVNTMITKAEHENWVLKTLDPLLLEYKNWREGKSPSYCNTTNCEGKYGSCDFLQICSTGNYDGYGRKVKDEGGKKK